MRVREREREKEGRGGRGRVSECENVKLIFWPCPCGDVNIMET